jgi:hypothetical protein
LAKQEDNMKNLILNAVREEAEKMYVLHDHVNLWMLARRVGFSTEIIEQHLAELGYVQISKGSFILKDDRDKATAKEAKPLEDINISSFKVSNDIELPAQDFIQDKKEVDYSGYHIHELRAIASNRGIKVAFSMKKDDLIKKLKSKLK